MSGFVIFLNVQPRADNLQLQHLIAHIYSSAEILFTLFFTFTSLFAIGSVIFNLSLTFRHTSWAPFCTKRSTQKNQSEMSRWKQRELQMLRRSRIQVQIFFYGSLSF